VAVVVAVERIQLVGGGAGATLDADIAPDVDMAPAGDMALKVAHNILGSLEREANETYTTDRVPLRSH
jgi:hypothetical protein